MDEANDSYLFSKYNNDKWRLNLTLNRIERITNIIFQI